MAIKKKQHEKIRTKILKIPARRGVAVHVSKGQKVKIINTHGTQVVDFWRSTQNIQENSCQWNTAG